MGSAKTSGGNDSLARYGCPSCPKRFDRRDTLSRHMHVHDRNRPPAKARRRACIPCAKSKTKCQAERPSCSACTKRGSECIYASPQSTNSPSVRTRSITLDQCRSLAPQRETDMLTDAISEGSSRGIHPNLSSSTGPGFLGEEYLPPSPLRSGPEVASWSQLDNVDFTSNLSWLFESGESTTSFMFSEPESFPPFSNLLPELLPQNNPTQPDLPTASSNWNSVADSAGSLQSIATDTLPSPHPQNASNPDDPWPMEWHAGPAPLLTFETLERGSCTPFSSKSHNSPSFDIPSVGSETLATIKETVQLAANTNPWSQVSLENFPDESVIDHFIDLFFTRFHPSLPIIHRPTFQPNSSIPVTIAVVSIGALYSEFDNAPSFSNTLSELTRCLLVFLAERDRRFVRTESYITAQLLQGIQGYCNGNERLFELSESSRSSLVHNARCMGLFRNDKDEVPADSFKGVQEKWLGWIQKERLVRLAWAVYEYDSSVCFLHNSRPYLSTSEINMALPSSSAEWDADTAEAWISLRPWSDALPVMPQLKPLLRSLFSGDHHAAEKITNDRHRLEVILTLLRMVWTCKEMKGSPIYDLVEQGLDPGNENLLRVLRQVQSSYSDCQSSRELGSSPEELVCQSNLVHIAHLYGAGDLMNFLYPLLRHDCSRASLPCDATMRLQKWAKEDPKRLRSVIYHCGQILGLARRHPTNRPFQPFAIFHSGVVLFYMTTVLPTPKGSDSNPPQLRLDQIALGQPSTPLHDWVESGYSTRLDIYGAPSVCSSEGRGNLLSQIVNLLHQRRVWGISQKFAKVVLHLRDQGEAGPSP